MTGPSPLPPQQPDAGFEKQAQGKAPSLVVEFFQLLRYNKKWWLTPILIMLLVAALLIVLGGSALAPFIYPIW